jgi:hypothetical protein
MITDHDVVQYFKQPPRRIPLKLIDYRKGEKYARQISRGVLSNKWENAHRYGCGRHLDVFAKHKVIPKYCFGCIKVVIYPRNVVELFKLLMIFEMIMLPADNTRKCMVEVRDYIAGTYKGFVYSRSIEEANEIYKIMRLSISENISPDVTVAIKRGCSEYETVYPEFAKVGQTEAMAYNDNWQEYEDAVDNEIASKYGDIDLRSINKARTLYSPQEIMAMQFWLRYAATIGDSSYIKIFGTTIRPVPDLVRPPFNNTI